MRLAATSRAVAAFMTIGRALSALLSVTRLHEVPGYVLAVIFILFPISLVGRLLNWALARTDIWPGLTVIGLTSIFLLLFATAMTNEQFLRDIRLNGMRWPTVLSVALAWLAVVVFGGASCGFERLEWVTMTPSVAISDGCATKYADMYLWHLMDAIPAISFNETLRWPEQYRYSGALGGWLLVAFKVLVIGSVLGSFVICGRLRREERQGHREATTSQTSPNTQVLV